MATYTLAFRDALDEYSHLDLTLDIVKEASDQIGGGGFSDVFRSKMRSGWQARADPHIQQLLSETRGVAVLSVSHGWSELDPFRDRVAVKRLRFWGRPIRKVEKAIMKELKIWSGLSHPNVLPILGYVQSWSGSIYPSFVSPWIENGSLRDYMKKDGSDVDILATGAGILSGLQYLHSHQVVHADLKCDNVLLSPTLRPLLTDFGVSRQIIASISTTTTASSGTLRWKAPELLNEESGKENEKSDVWAFGMTLLELLTKDIPYSRISDVQVVRSLVDGKLPVPSIDLVQRSVLYQYLWSLFRYCCIIDPESRPTALEVQAKLPDDQKRPLAPTEDYVDGKLVLFYVKAMYDYQATADEEFDFQTGDVIAVTSAPEDGWWNGILLDSSRRVPGRTVFPSNFVCLS